MMIRTRVDINPLSALKNCIAVSKEKGFFEAKGNHGKITVQRFEIGANMWSPKKYHF